MNSGVENLLLAFFGIGALLGAAMMVVLRSPMRVATALIATMVCLGAIYGLLGVHFIAAFQVLIYVGAVMVFMVYVIMLLNVRDESGPVWSRSLVAGLAASVLLLFVLLASVWNAAPPAKAAASGALFGIQRFSVAFLSEYWLHFELTSVLLLAAVIAALAIIRISRRVDAAQRAKPGHG
jgi:NADH-quinone oxidoreductase subunit J